MLIDVEVQRGDSHQPDNEHEPGKTTEEWKLGLIRRTKPEQTQKRQDLKNDTLVAVRKNT